MLEIIKKNLEQILDHLKNPTKIYTGIKKEASKFVETPIGYTSNKLDIIFKYIVLALDYIINDNYHRYTISLCLTLIFVLVYILIYFINPLKLFDDKLLNILFTLFFIFLTFAVLMKSNINNIARVITVGLFVASLIFIIYYYVSPFKILNIQTSNILILLASSLLVCIFFFLVYRQNRTGQDTQDTFYTNNTHIYQEKKESPYFNFITANYEKTLKNPIINLIKSFFGILALIIVPVLIITFIFWLFNNYHSMFYITKLILGFIILLTTLAIIAKIFKITRDSCLDPLSMQEDKDKKNAILFVIMQLVCLIRNFIFFIPCLLVIIADDIKKDIKFTPSSVYILFIIELVLICMFFFLPLIFKFISTLNKNDLLNGKGPFNLNKKKSLSNYQLLDTKNNPYKNYKMSLFKQSPTQEYNITGQYKNTYENKLQYNYTYSVSFYLYLNPQPNNTSIAYNKETELFNYANKPIISYDGPTRSLVIKSRTKNNEGIQLDTIYKTADMKYQKWIYFVINYENNVIDVFMDGKLVGSKNNVAPFFPGDKVTIGEDNGIHGSIRDIYYFETPRPQTNIEFLYDLTKN